ncbi:MAG: sigma-54-dependent Fis family transcriptional regulator [Candidatus Staskawiczbacteria bacterium]|nr:sigma-54-dependent Fis family transcriptional regulator [Candidatus Staskawiczbacteria bacterium]MBI3337492.1 sigma-54-dependent Fis family transcriptional regulator [Candidatus Staskawiczbacteria bacterium]
MPRQKPLEIIGKSEKATKIRKFAEKAAHSEEILFLRGQTGTGKDHLAEYIHDLGRSGNRFVTVDCGSIPESLCESILFGHVNGAYTDAKSSAEGLLSVAKGGTLFLNEVANMPMTLQTKFLRVLDTTTFRPIGSTSEIPINTRIIAATNANVERAVRDGKLRDDLYHRLNAVTFAIPALRERKEDIPLLFNYFLGNLGNNHHFSSAAIEIMESYFWPGNVRELKLTVERAVFHSGEIEVIEKECLGLDLENNKNLEDGKKESEEISDEIIRIGPINGLFPRWEEMKNELMKKYLTVLLRKTKGNQSSVARISGLRRQVIGERMVEFNISKDRDDWLG